MNSRSLLFAQLATVAVLAVLHIYALENFLYWRFPLMDIASHLLGGLWAGLFAFWISVKSGNKPNIIYCIGIVLAIGMTWEFFEALSGVTNFSSEMLDTLVDVSMDIVGGIAGLYLSRLISKPLP